MHAHHQLAIVGNRSELLDIVVGGVLVRGGVRTVMNTRQRRRQGTPKPGKQQTPMDVIMPGPGRPSQPLSGFPRDILVAAHSLH